MRPNWSTYFIELAHKAAERSTCPRRHVGAIIVKDNNVLSTGYNGSLPGESHCDDVGCLIGESGGCIRTVHAEQNAISRTSRLQRSSSTLFCTDFPCLSCGTLICRAGIVEVVYDREYRTVQQPVMELFSYHGIVCRKYASEETHSTHGSAAYA